MCMQDRRGFLKLFGIGAAVVPVIGGMPAMDAEAKLIEVPKVELITDPASLQMPPAVMFADREAEITVLVKRKNGERFSFTANTFITEYRVSPGIELPTHGSRFVETIPGYRRISWEMRGELSGEARNLKIGQGTPR